MPAFTLSKDVTGALRVQKRGYPLLSQADQITLELSVSIYGHLVQRKETLTAPEFLQRIRANYQSSDPRQAEIERVVQLCFDHWRPARRQRRASNRQTGKRQGEIATPNPQPAPTSL